MRYDWETVEKAAGELMKARDSARYTPPEQQAFPVKRACGAVNEIVRALQLLPPVDEKTGRCYTILPVLPYLIGQPWDELAQDLVQTIRPSEVRVIAHRGSTTMDALTWRVTVYLVESGLIDHIEQEVAPATTCGAKSGHEIDQRLRARGITLRRAL